MKTVGQRDLLVDVEINQKYFDPIDKDSKVKLFPQKTDAYLLAAVLGYKKGLKYNSTKTQSVRQAHELSPEQDLIIQTIGFCANGNIDLLVPEIEPRRQLFKLIEEYANGGAKLLHDLVVLPNDNTKPLDQQVHGLLKNIDIENSASSEGAEEVQ